MEDQKLSEKIFILRTSANLTQAELAQKIGCSQVLVSHWEIGDRRLRADYLVRLSKVFKISLDDLLKEPRLKIKKEKKPSNKK
jgi:transcriptional regulator with XRE-family HTH domain